MKKKKVIHAVIGEYKEYLNTGIIPWDQKNPSKEVIFWLRFLGLDWALPKKFQKVNKRRKHARTP